MSRHVTNARVAYGGVLICWLLLLGLAVVELVAGNLLLAAGAGATAWAVAVTVGRWAATDLKRAHEFESLRDAPP